MPADTAKPLDSPDFLERKATKLQAAMDSILTADPHVTDIPAFAPTGEYAGMRAVTFDGLPRGGRKTKVFGYLGYPEGASEESPVPAIVLLHGGGGHAFPQWVKMWNECGYAAIAIDHTGYFPIAVNAGSHDEQETWQYGLNGCFLEEGYTNAPDNDEMRASDGDLESLWMYHAVAQAVAAGNVLRADPLVDAARVGITGISWGGVITPLAIGYDNRFAFAIPIYGSGYLKDAKLWRSKDFENAATRRLFSAEDRFSNVAMPVLWLCWNEDFCFSINSNSDSYRDTVKNNTKTRLSIRHEMYHSHVAGWEPPESMAFADSVTKGTPALTGFATHPEPGDVACTLAIDPAAGEVRARVFYITEPMTYSRHLKHFDVMTWMDQDWQIADLDVEGDQIRGTLPEDAVGYYIELQTEIGSKTTVTCSPYTELPERIRVP